MSIFYKGLIDTDEALKLSEHCTYSDIFLCKNIMDEFYKKKPSENMPVILNGTQLWSLFDLLVTVWNAGRVHGIRTERNNRKRGPNVGLNRQKAFLQLSTKERSRDK